MTSRVVRVVRPFNPHWTDEEILMKNKVIWALGALNVLLALGLLTPLMQPAEAQAPRPGDYLMIPGEIVGGNNALVWMIDGRNQQLSAVTLDNQGKAIEMMPPIHLGRLFGAGGAGGNVPPRGKN
jgi:hypothetical protein